MKRYPALIVTLTVAASACGVQTSATVDVEPTSNVVLALASPSSAATELVKPGTPTADVGIGAAGFPDPGAFVWNLVASGLESPVDIQFPADGSGRMFVVEQAGRIRILENGGVQAAPFLDLSDRVDSRGNEQGLLGLAFHPDYVDNGLLFVNYTDYQQHNVIARFRVSEDPSLADAGSEVRLIAVDDPFPNHNGGALAFGPDSLLYAGLGDGGGANDQLGNGQNTDTLLGSILRLDVNAGPPYTIPAGNPFEKGGGKPEIWAYGLRNPWRLSFDSQAGDLYIADVGQANWEEIDFQESGSRGGANFGWNYREGGHDFRPGASGISQLIDPVAEYRHNEGSCAVTGGYVYRGRMASWRGVYFYGDYCSGKIRGLLRTMPAAAGEAWEARLLYETARRITTFGQDAGGEVYFADRAGGIYRLEALP